jgi:hypothetical protein
MEQEVAPFSGERMTISLWTVHYYSFYGPSDEECDFIEGHFAEKDEGGYYIDEENFEDIVKELTAEEKEKFKNLLDAIQAKLKEEGGGMDIAMD